ncbi:MAG: hypothetical protein ACRDPR_15070 [Nocardioidaceae bacterium]
MTAIPASVAEVNPAWLGEALGAEIAAVDVVDAHSGTTGRAKIRPRRIPVLAAR